MRTKRMMRAGHIGGDDMRLENDWWPRTAGQGRALPAPLITQRSSLSTPIVLSLPTLPT